MIGATEEDRVVRLPSGDLRYVLRRSPRSRGLRVQVDPLRGVVVTIPAADRRGWRRPEHDVERFLVEREGWIRRHLERAARRRAEVEALGGVTSGARIRYRGVHHELVIEPGDRARRRSTVERVGDERGDRLVVLVATRDRRTPAAILEAWFRDRAVEAIDRAIALHAPALRVTPSRVGLRDPRTRWGSAARSGALSFSWRLVLAPPEALETVVIHELAHLRVFGHGPRFWEVVESRKPDHLVWRRWLRAHAHEVHAALEAD